MGVSWFHTQPGWAEGFVSRSIRVSHSSRHFASGACVVAFKHFRSTY